MLGFFFFFCCAGRHTESGKWNPSSEGNTKQKFCNICMENFDDWPYIIYKRHFYIRIAQTTNPNLKYTFRRDIYQIWPLNLGFNANYPKFMKVAASKTNLVGQVQITPSIIQVTPHNFFKRRGYKHATTLSSKWLTGDEIYNQTRIKGVILSFKKLKM